MEAQIWKSEINSSLSSLGRAMATVLGSSPRELDAAFSRLNCSPARSSGVLLDSSLCFLRKYVKDAVERKEPLDQILVPMIEHAAKASKNCKQVLRLLNWIFQDEDLFLSLSSKLAEIIIRKQDHYISLGWCTVVRVLVDQELDMDHSSDNGKHDRLTNFLKILCQSISHLASIICKGSALDNGFELPTRLSVAAADCVLVLTEAASKCKLISKVSRSKTNTPNPTSASRLVTLLPDAGDKVGHFTSRSSQELEDMEMELLLWNHLDELIVLVQKLQAWNRKSRPLHAKGLGKVLKWLQEMRGHCGRLQDGLPAGEPTKTGLLLLSSCWKHYAKLMRLDDRKFSQHHREMLDQYISVIQFYTQQDEVEEHPSKRVSGIETRKFFLNCMSLLWGRLDNGQIELTMSECGPQISNLLFSQLQCIDDDITEGAVSILRTIIFRSNFPLSGCTPETRQLESVLPLLLNLLDERDCTARAVVFLVAEYCAINPNDQCLQEIFKRLDSENNFQRRNAIDVISELLAICSDSANILSHSVRQKIGEHLLERLGDEELANRVQASKLFSQLDPAFVLPALVRLVYSHDGRVRSSASDAIVAVLKCHNQKFDVVVMLLDYLRNISQNPDLLKSLGQVDKRVPPNIMTTQLGSKVDVDMVLKLIPKWSETVQDWSYLIGPLMDKMFAEPTNAIIIRFLSYISEHLADASGAVLHHVLLQMQGQKEMNEYLLSKWKDRSLSKDDSIELEHLLFERLCPLLIIRLLPLRVFDDLNSFEMYGQLPKPAILENGEYGTVNLDCIAGLLVNRAFHLFEFEDVRKLAAELCGRLHPQVILPIIGAQLEHATHVRDVLKIKACLFAVCTSLMIRGKDTTFHPIMIKIRRFLELALLWPSLDSDEVSKAQHGCIDCLAFMICAELQASKSSKGSTHNKITIVQEERNCPGDAASIDPVLTYVIQHLTCYYNTTSLIKPDKTSCFEDSYLGDKSPKATPAISEGTSKAVVPLPFRICMANVLISACQKISSAAKPLFARRTLPEVIHFVEVAADSEIKAACLQVLFTAVYHFKIAVLPYSSDLLRISIKALRNGCEKERIAGAKLMASLMASDDAIIESISEGLLEAQAVLAGISLMDSSSELRGLCEKLLVCIASPIHDTIFRSS